MIKDELFKQSCMQQDSYKDTGHFNLKGICQLEQFCLLMIQKAFEDETSHLCDWFSLSLRQEINSCDSSILCKGIHTFSSEVHSSHLTIHDGLTQSKPHQLCSVVGVLHQVGDDVLCCTWSSHDTLPLPPLGHSTHHRVPGDVVGEGEVVEAGPFVSVVPRYCDASANHHSVSECGWCSSVCTSRTRTQNAMNTHCISCRLLRYYRTSASV